MEDLRQLLDAAGVTIEQLAEKTGIDTATLSRACHGYRLNEDKQRRIAAALADALDHQGREVRKAKRTVSRIVESATAA